MEDANDKIFFLSPFIWFLGIQTQQSSPIIDEVGELNNHDKDWKNASVFLAMFSALSPSKYHNTVEPLITAISPQQPQYFVLKGIP